MDSLPTGSNTLLEIRTSKIDIVIKTKGKRDAEIVNANQETSSLRVVAQDAERIRIPSQEILEEYQEHEGIIMHELKVRPMFFEQTDYLLTIKARNKEPLRFQSYSRLIEDKIDYVTDDDLSLLSGVINFGNNIGLSDFSVFVGNDLEVSVRLEVFPSKISYKEDYLAMMTEVNDLVNESVLDFMRKTYQIFDSSHKQSKVPIVFFAVLESIYGKLLQATKRVLNVPHHRLITERDIVPAHKAKRVDERSKKWLLNHPGNARADGEHILAERVLAVRKRVTYDTYENQLVRFMLRSTVRRIEDFSRRYKATTEVPDKEILKCTGQMIKELKRIVSSSFLSEVSEYKATQSMSLVFKMAPGYRELYKYYLVMQCGITLSGDIFELSVRETSRLYEYWCFIKLYEILKDRYQLMSPDIIKIDKHGVRVDLCKGKPSRISFINPATNERFHLTYNPSEEKTQTASQCPDNVLELEKNGTEVHYKYVFDAKYRVEMNPDEHYPDKKVGPKLDDINTMHRYRDAIVFEKSKEEFMFQKSMFGAYILFPYPNEEKEYKEHRFYKSIDTVNIGGLPFLPSKTGLVTRFLDELITDSSESAFERAVLPAGIESRLKKVDWDTRDVLVGVVPDKEHLDRYINGLLYYMPEQNRELRPIRYIALYQSKNCKTGENGITFFGEIITTKVVSRADLPGKGRFPDKKYRVFEVSEWKKLPRIITGGSTRLIEYTNHFLLTNGCTYQELRLHNEEEYRLYMELKRRFNEPVDIQDNGDVVSFETEKSKFTIEAGNICVYRDGLMIRKERIEQFRQTPTRFIRKLTD